MLVGMMLYSFGWIGCILPAKGVGGGAAGLSLVLCTALENVGIHLQIGTMVFILNAILLFIAGFIVGWNLRGTNENPRPPMQNANQNGSKLIWRRYSKSLMTVFIVAVASLISDQRERRSRRLSCVPNRSKLSM